MGTARQPDPVKLIVGLLAREPALLSDVAGRLVQTFGPLEERSEPLPFNHTDYYAAELGTQPWRQFLAFAHLLDPAGLAAVKLQTNALEMEWAVEGRRPVNIDPGYISLSKLVLATTKNHWHRVYIGQGIYAEVTLPFRNGAFQPQEWTYPDYRTPESLAFFSEVRGRYHWQLREQPTAPPG